MENEELYIRLRQLISDMPDLNTAGGELNNEKMAWLGRAHLLVSAACDRMSVDPVSFRSAADMLWGPMRDANAAQIGLIVHRALAVAEAKAPAAAQGAFIAAGGAFDVFQVVGKVLAAARSCVLIVDPYLSAAVLTDFAVLVPENVPLNLLADSNSTKSDVLRPGIERWNRQYGPSRPIEIRLTAPRRLHDRLILVDSRDAWNLSQSLKDFAVRSPASVQRLDQQIAEMKIATYCSEWDAAQPL